MKDILRDDIIMASLYSAYPAYFYFNASLKGNS
jgi:hypothetical protein